MDDITVAVEMLLNISRQNISSGNANEALAAVIQAITISHPDGEGAVKSIFEAAKRKADEEIDEQVRQERLSSLRRAQQISRDLMKEETILSESGMQCIVRDAFEDGSSVVCTRCGALVPTVRADAHSRFWCQYATDKDIELEDDMSV